MNWPLYIGAILFCLSFAGVCVFSVERFAWEFLQIDLSVGRMDDETYIPDLPKLDLTRA